MNTSLNFAGLRLFEGEEKLRKSSKLREKTFSYSYSGFGPVGANCFRDFAGCLSAALALQKKKRDPLYVFEGTTRQIVCTLANQEVEYTKAGVELLNLER